MRPQASQARRLANATRASGEPSKATPIVLKRSRLRRRVPSERRPPERPPASRRSATVPGTTRPRAPRWVEPRTTITAARSPAIRSSSRAGLGAGTEMASTSSRPDNASNASALRRSARSSKLGGEGTEIGLQRGRGDHRHRHHRRVQQTVPARASARVRRGTRPNRCSRRRPARSWADRHLVRGRSCA